tara:strand:+ start:63 stop:611 length:549 start_codon:yes stop_codon:yes gene_type:complete
MAFKMKRSPINRKVKDFTSPIDMRSPMKSDALVEGITKGQKVVKGAKLLGANLPSVVKPIAGAPASIAAGVITPISTGEDLTPSEVFNKKRTELENKKSKFGYYDPALGKTVYLNRFVQNPDMGEYESLNDPNYGMIRLTNDELEKLVKQKQNEINAQTIKAMQSYIKKQEEKKQKTRGGRF